MPEAQGGRLTLTRFAWGVLAYNIAVILWGVYVRASGSGAGCGEHWPLCNGVVLPRTGNAATLIEFSHRLTSGLAFVAVVVLLAWTRRACQPGHPARRGAAWTVFFMLTEAAVGAGLVVFRLVADNASMARAMFMAVHLVNTFILLAWLSLTAWWLSGAAPVARRRRAGVALVLALGAAAIGLLLVGTSGAVAALGDTLFPHGSLAEAMAADLSSTSHALIRLRVLHPSIAVVVAVVLMFGAPRIARAAGPVAERLATAVASLTAIQLLLGVVNVVLLAPVWMQMIHLLVADAVWIAFVLLGAEVLAGPVARARAFTPAALPRAG